MLFSNKSSRVSTWSPIRRAFVSREWARRERWLVFKKRFISPTDWINITVLLALAVTGIFFIYSAQLYTGGTQYIRQIFWLVIGFGVYLGISLTDYRILLRYAHLIWIGSILLLLLVAFDNPLAGDPRGGARRWIDLRFFSFQPSETAKIAVLIFCAAILSRGEIPRLRESLGTLGAIALIIIPPILLIFSQPDLGSAFVIPPMVLSMLYVSRLPLRYFVAVLVAGILFCGVIALDIRGYLNHLDSQAALPSGSQIERYEERSWIPLRDYQRNRIVGFIMPGLDPQGRGWNLNQSLISVGSGGWDGKGWTQGTQAMLGYLPRSVAHTDFIFSVIAEEKGFLGGALVIGLFSIMLANGIRVASLADDRFGMLLCVGVTAIFAVHILVNIGMTLGLMPITGLPLPFLSYGGSFLLSCCFLQGLVQSVHRGRRSP